MLLNSGSRRGDFFSVSHSDDLWLFEYIQLSVLDKKSFTLFGNQLHLVSKEVGKSQRRHRCKVTPKWLIYSFPDQVLVSVFKKKTHNKTQYWNNVEAHSLQEASHLTERRWRAERWSGKKMKSERDLHYVCKEMTSGSIVWLPVSIYGCATWKAVKLEKGFTDQYSEYIPVNFQSQTRTM